MLEGTKSIPIPSGQVREQVLDRLVAEEMAERDKELAKERREASSRLKGARKELERAKPALDSAVEKAQSKLQKARDAVTTIEEELRLALMDLDRANGLFHAVEAKEHGILRSTASPRIDQFRERMRDLLEETRNEPLSEQIELGDLNLNTGKRVVKRITNASEREERILRILAAMRAAEELKLKACDIDVELAKLQHKIETAS